MNLANDVEATSSAIVALLTLAGAVHRRKRGRWLPIERRRRQQAISGPERRKAK